MASETLRGDLHEVKGHAKEAARATLMAMRSALDFAIGKLGGDARPDADDGSATPGVHRAAPSQATTAAAGEPEGTMASPPASSASDAP